MFVLEKEKRSKINYLSFDLKKSEKEQKSKHKVSNQKEIKKIRAEISETENR